MTFWEDNPNFTKSTCRGCGQDILWAVDCETRKSIPLDPTPPVYEFVERKQTGDASVMRRKMSWVSHVATCPKAQEFSQTKKKSKLSEATCPKCNQRLPIGTHIGPCPFCK